MFRRELVLFLLILTCYSFFVQYPNVNQNSRFNLVMAIVHQGTLAIDRYHQNTSDKSIFGGHYYTDKAPGLSFLAVPIYWLFNAWFGFDPAGTDLRYPMYLVTVFVVGLPSALLAWLVFRFSGYLTQEGPIRVGMTLVFALGTLNLPFATMFFGHLPTTVLAFGAFYVAFLVRNKRPGPYWLLWSGFLAGLAALVEYPTVAIGGLVFLYILNFLPDKRWAVLYLAGWLPATALLASYNALAFGTPLTISYYQFNDPEVLAAMRQGVLGETWPSFSALWQITFGPRGLFVLSPVLLLAPLGLWQMGKKREVRLEAILFAAIFITFLIANAAHFCPLGGTSPGPRYLIVALPYLTLPLALLPRSWRPAMVILGISSITIAFLITATNPQAPHQIANPLPEYWWPRLLNRRFILTVPSLHYGLRYRESVALLAAVFGLAGGAGGLFWLAERRGYKLPSALLTAIVIMMLVAYLFIGFPLDWRHPGQIPALLRPAVRSGRSPGALLTWDREISRVETSPGWLVRFAFDV